jgi:lysophospholipase L1-like esterase
MSGAPNTPRSRNPSVTRRWVLGGILATCAVVVIAVSGGVTANDNEDGAGSTRSGVAPTAATDTQETESPQDASRTIGFIGDSWASGTGTNAGTEAGFAALTAQELGWDYAIFAAGGTGYLQSSVATGDKPFADRVDELIEFAPDVVVIQGSSNDSLFAAEEVEAAAEELFTAIKAALPDATIYAFGVLDSPAADDTILAGSRQGVSQAALDTDAIYIDPNNDEWLDLASDFADGYHPDAEGHEKVAHQLARQLVPGLAE